MEGINEGFKVVQHVHYMQKCVQGKIISCIICKVDNMQHLLQSCWIALVCSQIAMTAAPASNAPLVAGL